MAAKRKYFYRIADRIFAILNSRGRDDSQDAMVATPLDEKQIEVYGSLKEEGRNDSTIFRRLFHRTRRKRRAGRTAGTPAAALDPERAALVRQIKTEMNAALTSANDMDPGELERLLERVKNLRQ